MELINCLIRENVAGTADNGSGGAMFNAFDSDPILTNCTLANNAATSGDFSPGFGGGMYNFAGSDPDLSNCILWGNANGDGGTGGSAQIFNNNDSTPCNPVVNFTCIQGGWDGVGNISDDPLFADPGEDDFHLQADSPCIDTGSSLAVPEDILTDLDGNPRIVDGDGDGDGVVDMGAYESPEVATCAADLDGDEQVGPSDLAILLGSWGLCAGCPADLNGDGAVGPFDLAQLLGDWGPCD